jgi:hypothetical protein
MSFFDWPITKKSSETFETTQYKSIHSKHIRPIVGPTFYVPKEDNVGQSLGDKVRCCQEHIEVHVVNPLGTLMGTDLE